MFDICIVFVSVNPVSMQCFLVCILQNVIGILKNICLFYNSKYISTPVLSKVYTNCITMNTKKNDLLQDDFTISSAVVVVSLAKVENFIGNILIVFKYFRSKHTL